MSAWRDSRHSVVDGIGADVPTSRFLSQADCQTLLTRLAGFAIGGGTTQLKVQSSWTGNLRWARNQCSSSGDVRNNQLEIIREIRGASGGARINQLDIALLRAAIQRSERGLQLVNERAETDMDTPFLEPFLHPQIWFDATFNQNDNTRAEIVQALVQPAAKAGVLAAGYIEVSATGRAEMTAGAAQSTLIQDWYYPYTLAQCSMTVRDPQGSGSGWAGVSWNDWSRIDGTQLCAVALEKCLRSRNPVRLEPGRYTTILEPQAVFDLTKIIFERCMSRQWAEGTRRLREDTYIPSGEVISPFAAGHETSLIGHPVIDTRLTVTMDPMDPDLGFPPFFNGVVFHPVTWIKDGVLQELSYSREYAVKQLGKDTGGYPNLGAFKMTGRGTPTSIEEMIATTRRGLLVTRFWGIPDDPLDFRSVLLYGYTRDGLWLIENGKISKPVKNFRFTESPLFVLNNVEQIGAPQRVFNPDAYRPAVVPALKVRDFSFTSLSDAI